MKFLCVSCNTQMKLLKDQKAVVPDKNGSLSIQYECPECLMVVAMLTNPFETQLVSSLGVEIGGQTISESGSKCPFSGTARAALEGSSDTKLDLGQDALSQLPWTAQALVRLQKIPDFVRMTAKKGIEKFALDHGYTQVNEKCLDEAKEHFNM